ncbi:hypothetical protein RKD45_005715 [Streptomyces griseus]
MPRGVQQGAGVAADGHGAVLEVGAGGGQGERDVGGSGVLASGDVLAQPGDLAGEGLGVAAGDDPGHGRGRRRDGRCRFRVRGGGLLLGRGLFQHHVGVGAADAEGGDGGAARGAGVGPGASFQGELDGSRVPVDLVRGGVDVQGGRHLSVAHRHDHLDDTGDARGGLGVTEVGLDGAQQQRPVGGVFAAVGGQQRLGFDRVAERGARAVRLHHVDVGGGEARAGQRLADDPLLGGAVGRGQPAAGAVGVDGGAPHHGEHRVAVAPRVGEAFHEQHAGTLAPAGAVGGGGEGLAAAVGSEPALPAEVDERLRGGHHGDPARQRQGALAGLQRAHRPVQGDQRGGAGGVDGDDRALQAEGVGDAPGGDARGAAVGEVAVEVVGDAVEPGGVVVVHHAGEHPGAAPAQRGRHDAGPLERLEGGLQQQALLRVHGEGLAGADAEEVVVEVGGVVQEATGACVGRAGPVRVGVVQGLHVPAAVAGELRHGVGPRRHQVPQVLGRGDTARVAAADADNGHRSVCALFVLAQPASCLPQVRGRPPEVVEQLLFVVHQRAIRSGSKVGLGPADCLRTGSRSASPSVDGG